MNERTDKENLLFIGFLFSFPKGFSKPEKGAIIKAYKEGSIMLYTYHLTTPVSGFVSITAQVKGAVAESGVQSGICVVYCPHTTAGITINENADPDVQRDLLLAYAEAFPDRKAFRHAEGNSAAHAKASAIGSSATVIVEQGKLLLGTWQGIYFCEFDGVRNRTFYVKILADCFNPRSL